MLRSALREMRWALLLWCLAAVWTLGVAWRWGYARDPTIDPIHVIGGFPDWVFWGIVVPWGCCSLFSLLFSLWFMKDDPLDSGDEHE